MMELMMVGVGGDAGLEGQVVYDRASQPSAPCRG